MIEHRDDPVRGLFVMLGGQQQSHDPSLPLRVERVRFLQFEQVDQRLLVLPLHFQKGTQHESRLRVAQAPEHTDGFVHAARPSQQTRVFLFHRVVRRLDAHRFLEPRQCVVEPVGGQTSRDLVASNVSASFCLTVRLSGSVFWSSV